MKDKFHHYKIQLVNISNNFQLPIIMIMHNQFLESLSNLNQLFQTPHLTLKLKIATIWLQNFIFLQVKIKTLLMNTNMRDTNNQFKKWEIKCTMILHQCILIVIVLKQIMSGWIYKYIMCIQRLEKKERQRKNNRENYCKWPRII